MKTSEMPRAAEHETATMDSPSSDERPWHSLTIAAVESELQTDSSLGLSQAEATRRATRYGPNSLAAAKQRSAFSILWDQFRSLIVALLVVATAIAFAMGDSLEGIAILVVIVLNAGIGFFTEWRAAQALSALQKQAEPVAHVIRDGTERQIPAADLVPGDLAVLAAGAKVPADGRVIESARLQIEEAALTGESLAVSKLPEPIEDQAASIGDRFNMAYLGTTITDGRGKLLVTATGMQTEVGKIGTLIDDSIAQATPLEKKLARLGHLLIVVVVVLCVVIVGAGWLRGSTDFFSMLKIGLSLAIAAVPEGLPAVTTMTLAIGMQRMARMQALVRRLPAVETLGSVTVICTDKTGTLTKNEMTVRVFALDQRRVDVMGGGHSPAGIFQEGKVPVEPNADEQLVTAMRIGTLCNDAKVEIADGGKTVLGDPTEAALIIVAEKAGMKPSLLNTDYPRLSELPFDNVIKSMATVHRTPQGKVVAYVKGAPGNLIAASVTQATKTGVKSLEPADRKRWEETNQSLASSALRVLGLAYRELPDGYTETDVTKELTFVGLVGMSDPLREEAKTAIATCREAGIRTLMITGDQPQTATEIARQLEIDVDGNGNRLRTVHGRDLTGLDAEGWKKAVADAAVFARVSPKHKLQIVEALQLQGHVVAMTGDGVNDAPALKKADIGIAMGIKGTEVAKENADMVITDDNFTSIVGAVEQGRVIYGNILRFLHYLLSCNFSEILTVFIALMIGWPLPLVAIQILWLNLITDTLPAFALALETSPPDVMKQKPRDPREPLLPLSFVGLIVWQGLLLAGVTLLAFGTGMHWYGGEREGLQRATSMAFMTLALVQIFHVFNARSHTSSIFNRRLFTNGWLWGAVAICLALQLATVHLPLLQKILHTVALSTSDWGVIIVCSLIPVAVVELIKLTNRIFHVQKAGT